MSERRRTWPQAGLSAVLVTSGLVLGGCAETRLEPAARAHRVSPDSDVVYAENAGITVMADTEAWRGGARVDRRFVPVELRVINNSGRSVYISVADIRLAGAGRTLTAVSPDSIRQRPLRTTLGMPPLQADIEGGSMPHMYNAMPDPDDAYTASDDSATLLGGPLADGENMRGFVYFPEPPPNLERVEIVVTLRSSPGGEQMAELAIPLRIER